MSESKYVTEAEERSLKSNLLQAKLELKTALTTADDPVARIREAITEIDAGLEEMDDE